jgi:excinuclease ABC subunit C
VLAQVRRLPRAPGVYRFRDERGTVLYLGRATDLRSRVASYWSQRDRPRLIRMINRVARVEVLTCDSVHEAAWLERNLLEQRMPRWNRTPGGQEVPVYLRLDRGPARPGLRLSHSEGFGPFLGGVRARLALSALHRIHPLAYAGTALTGAEAEMAAVRAVGPADRPRLIAAVEDVLGREPAALAHARATLVELRDRAAAELAFERAGQIQDEIEALAWVTSPQRVAVTGGGDLVVRDWAHGVQISLEITGGHLRTWTLRRTAHPPAEAPPPGWADFARRNVELAAALISG